MGLKEKVFWDVLLKTHHTLTEGYTFDYSHGVIEDYLPSMVQNHIVVNLICAEIGYLRL